VSRLIAMPYRVNHPVVSAAPTMKITSSATAIQSRGPRTVRHARRTLATASRACPRTPPFTAALYVP
jgi:hypothetical protein